MGAKNMTDFLQGLLFGMILQVSVGPVCIAVLHKGITQGFHHAFAMVWGVALVDAAYIVLSVAGLSALLQIESVRYVIGLGGALLLIYFGIRYFRAPPLTEAEERVDESLFKSFSFGAGLTLTNPLTILFWAGVLGAMMSTRTFASPSGVVLFSVGCVVATVVFLTAVALAGHLLERVLTPRLSLWLNRLVGLFLIGFAVKLIYDLLT
jgi:threonine/homoserine/homoserine lactone efflux protein